MFQLHSVCNNRSFQFTNLECVYCRLVYNVLILNSLQQPAINTLREVESFLNENPTEIVTIIIEDYVHTPKGLINLFTNAGLGKYWFPVSKMPKKGEDWPTVTEMVQENHRLVVFTSVASKEAEEGIAYQWKYMLENEGKHHICKYLLVLYVCLEVHGPLTTAW